MAKLKMLSKLNKFENIFFKKTKIKNVIKTEISGFISLNENKFRFIIRIFSINLKILRINNAIAVDNAAPIIPYCGINIKFKTIFRIRAIDTLIKLNAVFPLIESVEEPKPKIV
mgnify:CR=1 FL=1